MIIEGEYTCELCGETFERNVDIAAHKSKHQQSVSEEEVREEIQRFADELGKVPTMAEFDSKANLSSMAVKSAFGTWNEGLQSAGLTPNIEFHSKEEVIEEIRDLTEDLGHVPTTGEMEKRGGLSPTPARVHFDSWSDAIRAAGFHPPDTGPISADEAIRAIQELATELDRTPTAGEMDELGDCSVGVVQRIFGSWNKGLRRAGFTPNLECNVPREQLVEEVQALEEEVGHPPSTTDLRESGTYALGTYHQRWDSWEEVLAAAGYDLRGYASGPRNRAWEGGYEDRYYGPNWSEQRKRALERDDFRCQMPGCNLTREKHRELYDRDLTVHHLIPIREFDDDLGVGHKQANRLENLVTLCLEHHSEWEHMAPLRPDTRHLE